MASRTLHIDGPEWVRLQKEPSSGTRDSLAQILAEHRDAPVRGRLVAVNRDRGVQTDLSMLGGQIVLVTRRLAQVDGQKRIEPGAQVTFTTADGLWQALGRTLPNVPQLRAAASATGGIPDQDLDLSHAAAMAFVGREDFALRVLVEAWTGTEAPAVIWARQWSTTDGRLLDVRTNEDGTMKLTERPPGSVAAELRWAMLGAIDATSNPGSERAGR